MFQAMQFLAILLLLLITRTHSQRCPSKKLTPAVRADIAKTHNRLRSSLANGQEKNKGRKYMPSGSNVYKLNWDCELEKQAQRWADKCTFTHSDASRKKASENLYWASGGDLSAAKHGPAAVELWWKELTDFGVSDSKVRLTLKVFNAGVGHFTAAAWGSSTKVGCGFNNNCKWNGDKAAYVVCQYRPQGNILNTPIYQIGEPCSDDSDCTTYPRSKCLENEGLCYTR